MENFNKNFKNLTLRTANEFNAVRSEMSKNITSEREKTEQEVRAVDGKYEGAINAANERIDEVKQMATQPIQMRIVTAGDKTDLQTLFNNALKAQRKQYKTGQTLLVIAEDGGSVTYNDKLKEDTETTVETTSGDTFTFDVDPKGNISNVFYDDDKTSDRLSQIERNLANLDVAEIDFDTLFKENLK